MGQKCTWVWVLCWISTVLLYKSCKTSILQDTIGHVCFSNIHLHIYGDYCALISMRQLLLHGHKTSQTIILCMHQSSKQSHLLTLIMIMSLLWWHDQFIFFFFFDSAIHTHRQEDMGSFSINSATDAIFCPPVH